MNYAALDGDSAPISNVTAVTSIVPAPGPGLRIVVLGYKLNLDADGEYSWSSAANVLTGTMELTADTPDGAFCGAGVLRCRVNEALRLTSSTAANGFVRYVITRG